MTNAAAAESSEIVPEGDIKDLYEVGDPAAGARAGEDVRLGHPP